MDKSLTSNEKVNELEKQSCWEKRSKREKRLIICAGVLVLVLVLLLLVLVIYFTSLPSTCVSSSCVKSTNELLKLVRTDVNPCDDFYEFACGNYAKNTHLQEKSVSSIEDSLFENINNRMRSIVEEPVSKHDSKPLTLVKGLYRACLDQDAIDLRGLVLIQEALNQIGGWPVLEGSAWNEWNFEWKLATYKLRELGYHYQFFITLNIIPDASDPSKAVIMFSPPDTPLDGATEEDEELFFEYMVNISVAFGANRALARNDFRDVIDFQKSLFLNLPEDNKARYDPLTISELRHKFSDIPWMEYINRLIYPIQSISNDQTAAVKNEAYFRRLQNALRRISKRVVANYIAWRIVRQQSVFLTSELSELSWNYYSAMVNQAPPTATKKCSDLAEYVFPLPLQAEYVRRFISINSKSKVTDMLSRIKKAFTYVIGSLDWMDMEAQTAALERIALTTGHVLYPNALLEPEELQEFYDGVEVDGTNFFQSMLQASFFLTNRKFQKLHKPFSINYDLNEDYATSSRVYYTASDNSITIPAGVLQGGIYDENRPQSTNYGALGSSIGHQVFHIVFEGKCSSTDTRDYEWLSTRTLLNFDRKLSCVERHYGEYLLPEIEAHLNSSNTKYEDIADIAGVKLAYNAYKILVSENGLEQKLPGLDYTQQQLFWISYALRFCSRETSKSIASTIAHSYRSPPKHRVLGALQNLEEFSRDFGCPSNSYMNNRNKCNVL